MNDVFQILAGIGLLCWLVLRGVAACIVAVLGRLPATPPKPEGAEDDGLAPGASPPLRPTIVPGLPPTSGGKPKGSK